MITKFRAWLAKKTDKGCEQNWHGLLEGPCPCGKPSVGAVWIFHNRFRVCAYHLEPLTHGDREFSALNFLSRWNSDSTKINCTCEATGKWSCFLHSPDMT